MRGGDKDLFHIETGLTPKTDVKEYWENGNIKWVTPKDLGKLTNKFIFETERKITQDGLNSCSTTIIPKGSIIIISTRAPIGHITICGDEMCFNQGCKGICHWSFKIPQVMDTGIPHPPRLPNLCFRVNSHGG